MCVTAEQITMNCLLMHSGRSYVEVRLLSSAPVGNYSVEFYLLVGGGGWTSRLASSEPKNITLRERPSAIGGSLFTTIVHKFRPTYVRIFVYLDLNFTVLRAVEENVHLFVRLIHRATGVNYEFNSVSSNRTSTTSISKFTRYLEIYGRM